MNFTGSRPPFGNLRSAKMVGEEPWDTVAETEKIARDAAKDCMEAYYAVNETIDPSPERLAEAIKVADRAALIATLISEKLRAQLAATTATAAR
jgi:hypothetical protein